MADVKDYVSGNILSIITRGFRLMGYLDLPILGAMIKRYILLELKKYKPIKIKRPALDRLIQASEKCAVGQRVCNALNEGADFAESVFLDELASGLVEAGKARYVNKQEALDTIINNRKGPIVITRVSGKHMEICRCIPKNCIYWNAEKNGLKCILRNMSAWLSLIFAHRFVF